MDNKVLDLIKTSRDDDAKKCLPTSSPALEKWFVTLEELVQHQEERSKFRYTESMNDYKQTRVLMLVLGALAVALAFAVGFTLLAQ